MKPWHRYSAYAVFLCLFTGCARTSNSTYNFNYLNRLALFSQKEAGEAAAQPPAEHICILDPVALAEHIANEPGEDAPVSGRAPAVVVPETSFDFGKITEEKEFSHVFSIKNEGQAVLKIKKVLPG